MIKECKRTEGPRFNPSSAVPPLTPLTPCEAKSFHPRSRDGPAWVICTMPGGRRRGIFHHIEPARLAQEPERSRSAMRGTPSSPASAGRAAQPAAPAFDIDRVRGGTPPAGAASPSTGIAETCAPAMDIDAVREASAARIAALADAAAGAAGAASSEALAGVLRRACCAALPCDGFRFSLYDTSDVLRSLAAFPATAAGDDEIGWRAVRERRPQAAERHDGTPAVLSAPVLAEGAPLGVLVVTSAADAGFCAEDLQVLEAMAGIAASGLLRLRLAEEHRDAVQALEINQALERRVEQRTQELAHANDALAAEVQQHRAAREELLQRTLELEVVFRALPDLYFRLSDDGRILSYRAGADNALYALPEEFLGRPMREVMPPEVGRAFDEACARVRETG